MAKKTSSVHIESTLWDYIDEYQKKNGISSRNTAIEWMLVEHRGNCSTSSKKDAMVEENSKKDTVNHNIEPRETDILLEQMENDMKE